MERKTYQRIFAVLIIFIMIGSSIAFAFISAINFGGGQTQEPARPQNQTIVLLEYGCENCTQLVSGLQAFANKYAPYIDVKKGGTALISMSNVLNATKLETFDSKLIEDFICNTFAAYRLRNEECLFRAV